MRVIMIPCGVLSLSSIYTSRIHVFFFLSLYRKLKRMCAMTLSVSPWISGAFAFTVSSSTSSSSSSSNPSSFHFSFSSGGRVACRAHYVSKDLKFVLHHALDALGIDIAHAKVARDGFCTQIQRLSDIERETSISINRGVDLGKAALFLAAEDDSLISHSSVPLPVDSFIERLDDLSMDYCSHYSSAFRASPEVFLETLEKYLYINKGFRRTNAELFEPRALYLHSVLTHRSGSTAMLSLIYSEILKMLRLWGLLDFDVEIFFPHDAHSLPRGYHKQKSKESDQPHIMTSQSLLVEMLKNLKDAFWPFQHDNSRSLFLRAAHAANCVDISNTARESGFELASAKAAQHRLDRGVWTSVKFGDMRRALSACERLILLETDLTELRDYSILLYHCGFYEQSLQYLKLYNDLESSSIGRRYSDSLRNLEEDAVEKLMVRLNLILMEEGWSCSTHRSFLGNNSEPW